MANLILPRRFTEKPGYIAPLDLGGGLFSSKSIFHGFSPASQTLDQFNNVLGSVTGSAAIDSYGLVTGSGNYVTGSTTRPKYTGATLTFCAEIALPTLASSATTQHIVGTAGDQFFKLELTTSVENYVAIRPYLFIAGSQRSGGQATTAPNALTSLEKLFVSVVWKQPFMYTRMVRLTTGQVFTATSSSYGAPLDDRQGALLFGKDSAGSYPFSGKIKYAFFTERALSDAEILEIQNDSNLFYAPRKQVLYFDTAGAGAQTLLPSLFTDGDTFHAATVSVGAVTLTPALYSDGDTFHAATVSQGGAPQTLTPDLYADGDTFHTPTVGRGTVILTPSLYADGDTFHDATVSNGAIALTPTLFSDGDTFHAATVAPGAVTLTPALFTDGDTFHDAAVSNGAVTLAPDLFSDGDTFYAATVAPGAVTLTPALFTDADTFHNHVVGLEGGPQTLVPDLVVDGDTFHAATVTPGAVSLAPSIYTDADTFHAAEVAAGYNLQPAAYADGDTFHSATVSGGAVTLAPDLFADGDTFYSATVANAGVQALEPGLLTDADTFYVPTVTGGARTIGAARSAGRQLQTSARSNIQTNRR